MNQVRRSGNLSCVRKPSRRWSAGLLLVAGLAVLLLTLRVFATAAETPESRLMRFPDVYKDKVVFSYGGDLWLVTTAGGEARRITTHPGLELFPKFSPDGKWIAFTGQYDGNFNVYIMPSQGGQPKQLTFLPDIADIPERMGPNNELITWFPDSRRILFLSRRNTMNTWFGRLFSVSIDGGLPEQLPLDKGGLTSFSPDGTKIAYNRIFRNFRTWKRYKGGMAQDIWIYDFKANHIEQITDYPGTDTFPMWHGDTIYFVSDRGPEQRQNLYRYDLGDHKTRQLTHFKDFDVNWPSLGPDSIVFENGGYLYLFDLKTEQARKLTVQLSGDSDLVRKHWEPVASYVTSFDLAPNGQRAVFTARGDVYTAPAKEGSVRNLTRSPGSRERFATWSPDGKWVAYVSDRTGEDELYITPQDGMGKEVQITSGRTGFLLQPVWSPDSKQLLYADSSVNLFYANVDEKKSVRIDQGHYDDITDYAWSPDSKWAAYAKAAENHNPVLYLYSLADQKITPVTDEFTSSWNPVFDPEGRYLYFLSNRSYNEVLGVYDMEFSNPKATGVYLATLRSDLPSPFAPKSDEGGAPEAAKKEQAKTEEKTRAGFRIDLDGIGNRIVAVPITLGNLGQLAASKDALFFVSRPTQGIAGPLPGEAPSVQFYDLNERKGGALVADATAFALSFDGTKVLYAAPKKPGAGEDEEEYGPVERTFGIVDAKLPEKEAHKAGDGALDLAEMKAELDPRAEWAQIFREVWRQERDFFFERAMNGVDWEAERKLYEPLVSHAASRYDLTYILGEMIGELSNSHTYVGGGDYPDLKPVNVGLLGVDFQADTTHGFYRFGKIYPGENWDGGLRSPLTEPGVGVKEGDYLISVNGRPLDTRQNPYELFVNTADKDVVLEINSMPTPDGARKVTVRPISSEFGLRELDWITANRKKVDALSGGKVGYVYLPDMSARGLNAFVKQFFPQIRKEGMIIDVRYNGGGFVDQLIFERLRRVLAGMNSARNWRSDTIPDDVFHGFLACVTNHYAASDGDFFTYFFERYKLGPVVGERTWGGVRGIRGYIPLMDAGYITRPEFSLYGLDRQWLIENHGVDPDYVVDNRPDLVREGKDPQLEKAVELVMKEVQAHPPQLPTRPPDLPAYPAR
jgi:tricorn protease